MAEPPAKKAKTDEVEAADQADEGMEDAEPQRELEEDALLDGAPKIKEPVIFRTEDTTLNVMPSSFGNVLMPLSDGGLQYLLAGARANVGIKSGRYMFEAKVVEVTTPAEDPSARSKTPMPRSQLRLGVSTANSGLFLGEGTDGVCFDTEGAMIFNRTKSQVSQKFASGDTLAIVLNLDGTSQNNNTISLFKNGERACAPQALPDELKNKALFPTLTFKNLTVHYNFGPSPLAPLPFTCRMVSDAAIRESAVAKKSPAPKDGKYDVVFPVCLPDEGTFDWLDLWLLKNPGFTELSDRSILKWAEASGLVRTKATKTSNDKPEMGFGVSAMDDASVRRVVAHAAPIQGRNYVVMEVKQNLLKDERKEAVAKWPSTAFKRTAMVVMGNPPAEFKHYSQKMALQLKQEASDLEFNQKKSDQSRKKMVEKRQKELEKERKKALKTQKKMQEIMKRKLDDERRKQEAINRGEDPPPMTMDTQVEEPDDDDEEEEKEDEQMEEQQHEEPPKVELSPEERRQVFCKRLVPDLSAYNLNTTFTKYTIPEKDEGFDEIKYEWTKQPEKCKEYIRGWVQDRKLTTRVEDITPSQWFVEKYKEWQKSLSTWHQKQNQWKAAMAKKQQEMSAKEAAKAVRKAAREKAKLEAEAKKKAAEAAGAEVPSEPEKAEEPEDDENADAEDASKADFDRLDVFGVEDIFDVGGGEPLFMQFNFEDWTMMGLRFEIHLITHSFKRDVNDQDRIGIHVDHLPFYYNKYFKKALNTKFYGCDTVKELLDYIRDTIVVNRRNQVIEPQLPDDMESLGIFAMLTEEARRDRNRRIDLGDESAKLKLTPPQGAAQAQQGATVPAPAAARPGMPAAGATVRPPANQWGGKGGPQKGGYQPQGPLGANYVKGYQPGGKGSWNPTLAQWRG